MASQLPGNGFRLTAIRDALDRITDFRVTEASAIIAAMVRRPLSQVAGSTLRQIFPTPRIDRFVDRFAEALASDAPQTDEYPIVSGAVEATWVRQTATREDADTLLVLIEDLSAERQRAVQLAVSTRLRELLFERSTHSIVLVAPDGKIVEANAAFATLMQMEPTALIGLRLPDHLDCPPAEAVRPPSFRCKLRSADGEWRPIEISETPLPYDYRQLVIEDRSEIAASERRYRTAMHAAGLSAWEMHQATEALIVSESYRTLFDLPPDAPLPTTIAELRAMVHPDDRERVYRGRLSLPSWNPGETVPFEVSYRIITPSGEIRWMRTRGELVRANANDPGIIYAITRDITLLVETEARLRESEEQFRSAFDDSAIGMALVSNEGTTLRVNAALANMFGYTLEDAVRTQWHQILHPDEIPEASVVLREIAAGQLASSRAERRCLRRDGTLVWTQMTVAGVRGQSERPPQMIVQAEDITERKLSESARAEAEERLGLVLEATRDGVWDWDCVTGKIYFGPQWFGMLGYPAEGRFGDISVFTQLVHPEDLTALWPAVERHLEAPGEDFDKTFRMRHAEGHWVWIRARGRAFSRDAEGRAVRMVGTHTDVTHQKALEEQIRHGQKMDAVGKLAGGIAHDFNNLLTAIGSTTELLLDTTSAGDPHEQDLQNIALAADRAKALTRQLLAFSRQDVEQSAMVVVDAVVSQVAPLLHRMLGPAQALRVELAAPDQLLRLDPANLELALLNLVANARDAMPDGGTVLISTQVVDEAPGLDAPAPRVATRFVIITVRDTGVGMTDEVRERIFEPFFTTKPQGKGTGLGMPTVYGFVRRLQGSVQVESLPGEGTTVRLILPILTEVDDSASVDARHLPKQAGRAVRRLLLVDDDEVVRRSTQRLLEHRGITVTSVESADEALATLAASTTPFDVVLTDHAMPGRTGFELLEEIEKRYPAQRVVLMSGFTDDDRLRHTFSNRDVPFLAKPFTLDELMEALEG
ncbi:MAG: PAS domain-containing protein [Gemmatimonadetes bacterium]|nr:PAS domain-containing protein [Gemmatimonadota bacterium]